MSYILKQVFNFLKILNSELGTEQIAAGIAVGFTLGLSPPFSIQSILLFLCIFIFRVQAGAAFISTGFFTLLAFFFHPIFHHIGSFVLEIPALKSIFTYMYNMPIIPLTQFNNSVVMGSAISALIFIPIVYFMSLYLVKKYRVFVVVKFKNSKFFKTIQATRFYKWYYKFNDLYGE